MVMCKFYDTLSNAYEIHSYSPYRIWNCDETSLQASMNCGIQVIGKRGSMNAPKKNPKSKEWITILCCINAIGQSITGFYLFKGKTQMKKYIENYKAWTCMATHPNAWMNKHCLWIDFSILLHLYLVVYHLKTNTCWYFMAMENTSLQTIGEANIMGIDLLTLPVWCPFFLPRLWEDKNCSNYLHRTKDDLVKGELKVVGGKGTPMCISKQFRIKAGTTFQGGDELKTQGKLMLQWLAWRKHSHLLCYL